jgi:predicted GIY-YIG superfamily endonuclease
MVFIYILQLENKKYYVGKTSNPDFRLEQHFNSFGSQWTKKYKPQKVIEIISNCDNFDEDKYTLKFMEKYGINNVRGGTFCELKLNRDNIEIINDK